MRKIRIGNDIRVSWEVKTNGEAVSLEGRALKLYVRSAYQKQEIANFSVSGCVISFVYPASMQRSTGARALVLNDATEGAAEKTICADQAFTLAAHTCEESDDDVDFEDFMISLQSNIALCSPELKYYIDDKFNEVDRDLSGKADKDDVDRKLDKKADKAEVQTALDGKVSDVILAGASVVSDMVAKLPIVTDDDIDAMWGDTEALPAKRRRKRRIIMRKAISRYTADDGRYEYAYVSKAPVVKIPFNVRIRIYINDIPTLPLSAPEGVFLDGNFNDLTFVCHKEGDLANDYVRHYVYISNNTGTFRCITTVKSYYYNNSVLEIFLKQEPYNNEPSYTGRYFCFGNLLRCTDIPTNNYCIEHFLRYDMLFLKRTYKGRKERLLSRNYHSKYKWCTSSSKNMVDFTQVKLRVRTRKNVKGFFYHYRICKDLKTEGFYIQEI